MQTVDETIVMMKPNYDNYCFSRSRLADCMFNSDMVLYFMKSFVLHGEKPDEIVDPNIRTDFNKLAYLIRLDHGLGENFSVIKGNSRAGRNNYGHCYTLFRIGNDGCTQFQVFVILFRTSFY